MGGLQSLSCRGSVRALLWLAGWAGAIFAASYLLGTSYRLTLGASAAISCLLAMSVVVLTGFAGQFSLASAAFYGMGAYGTALLTVSLGWSPLLAIVSAAAVAGLTALVIGGPILRLSGHFLAMGTLAVNEIFILLLIARPALTGGNDGMGNIPPFSVGSFDFSSLRQQFLLGWSVVGIALFLTLRIGRSRIGRALAFIQSDEAGASATGIDTGRAKTLVFALSAVLASVAGSLYAHFLSLVNPGPFGVTASIQVLVIAVLGGLATPWGAIVGGISYALLQEGIVLTVPRLFGEAAVGAGSQFVMGVLLVVLLIVRPQGLTSLFRFSRRAPVQPDSGAAPHALEPPAPVSASPIKPGTSVLKSVKLSRHFGGIAALSDCDLQVSAGEILAVIGPNGAGKSTLVHVLSGVLAPSAGQVFILDQDVTRSPSHTRASQFGMARSFQTPKIVTSLSVKANAALGAHRLGRMGLLGAMIPTPMALREEQRMDQAAMQALAAVGLSWASSRPARELSLGHRRLLEISRVIAQSPVVVLLDEPAAGLTRVEKDELVVLLKWMRNAGYGLVLVEHDMALIMALADRVQVLEFGKTIFCGSPEAARANPRVIEAYLGTRRKELVV